MLFIRTLKNKTGSLIDKEFLMEFLYQVDINQDKIIEVCVWN